MKSIAVLASALALGLIWTGCSEDEDTATTGAENEAEQVEEAAQAREEARAERRQAAARRQQAQRQRAAREEARARAEAEREAAREEERRRAEAEQQQQEIEEEEYQAEQASPDCHPSYTGNCLDPAMSDYDCAGGSGDGPGYTGTVQVVGPDDYDLDRDGDGVACE